ncbi:MAG: hypothetical protein ACFFD4_33985 [Candidatus Odinarchaeota archaeon]
MIEDQVETSYPGLLGIILMWFLFVSLENHLVVISLITVEFPF